MWRNSIDESRIAEWLDGHLIRALALGLTAIGFYAVTASLVAILPTSLWQDELYTLKKFVLEGPATIVGDYHVPNNHIFFNLLTWPVATVWPREPAAARWVSVASVVLIASMPLFFTRARGVLGLALLACLLGCNTKLIYLASQARGYGLALALSLIFSWTVARERKGRSELWAAILGIAMAYTIPAMLVFPVATMGWLALTEKSRRWLVASVVCSVVTVVLYLPVAGQLLAAKERYAGKWGAAFSSFSAVVELIGVFVIPKTQFRGLAELVILVVVAVAFTTQWRGDADVSARVRGSLRSRALIVGILSTLWAFVFLRTPPVRTATFLLAPAALLVGLWLEKQLLEGQLRKRCGVAVGVFLIALSWVATAQPAWRDFRPKERWLEVSRAIDKSTQDAVVAVNFRGLWLDFYHDEPVIEQRSAEFCVSDKASVFVDANFLGRLKDENPPDCALGPARFQQTRGGKMDVYFKPKHEAEYRALLSELGQVPEDQKEH